MQDTANKFCSILFDVLLEKGVKDVVCSPGSRNVPLLLAASARVELKKHFVVDERSAAFLGLGISAISRQPVALACTSGTALLNYSPAIAEAYYQCVPLIVVSADRPIQWIDQDDSQTIRQDGIISNFVKKSYTIPAIGDDNPEMQWYVNRIVNDAVLTAVSGRQGPVHINIHIAEPLGKKTITEMHPPRIIENIEADAIGNKETVRKLALILSQSKVMLVSGFNSPDSLLQKALVEFSRFPNVVVMAETISNLHLKEEDYSIDSLLTAFDADILDELAPDVVISIGGALVSRKLKEYLRRNVSKCSHWSLGYSHTTTDPFTSLTCRIETEPSRFFRNINGVLRKQNFPEKCKNYQEKWLLKRKLALQLKERFINNCAWSELKVFNYILNNIPRNCNLFLSNGTAIRYAQIIRYPLPHASYCNRGVSGIDGSVSTSIGGAIEYKGDTLLITGDLSMAYDIGSLGVKEVPARFKIIVIDNQGGGIFRFIPSTSQLEEREEYLCQPPLLPLKELAEGYQWNYFEVREEDELTSVFKDFLSSKSKSILKITTPGILSAEVLKTYMALKVTNL